jgi:hypothetical protein
MLRATSSAAGRRSLRHCGGAAISLVAVERRDEDPTPDISTTRVRSAVENTAWLTARVAFRKTEGGTLGEPKVGVADLSLRCACLRGPVTTS